MAKWLQPTLQRDMWSTRVTLNPIVLEDTIMVVDILMKSDYMLTWYTDPNMFPTKPRVMLIGPQPNL